MSGFLSGFSRFSRDIPPRATLVVVVLVLLASIGVGRETHETAAVVEPTIKRPAEAPASQSTVLAAEDLDLSRLERRRRETRQDLFSNGTAPVVANSPPAVRVPSSAPAAPAIVVPAAPPLPVAPPLPYKYLGLMAANDRTTVFLLKGEDVVMVRAGDTLESQYKVERITDNAVEFIYLPLGSPQRLAIPAAQ